MLIKDGKRSIEDADIGSIDASVGGFSRLLEDSRISFESQMSLSVQAANSLMSRLRVQLEPFRVITDEMSPWEEKSAAVRLSNKIRNSKRKKRWRKRKRKRVAEMFAKVIYFITSFRVDYTLSPHTIPCFSLCFPNFKIPHFVMFIYKVSLVMQFH